MREIDNCKVLFVVFVKNIDFLKLTVKKHQ